MRRNAIDEMFMTLIKYPNLAENPSLVRFIKREKLAKKYPDIFTNKNCTIVEIQSTINEYCQINNKPNPLETAKL